MRLQFDTNINHKDRERIILKDFLGLDGQSPIASVASQRATRMKNLISRDGHNHKRFGYRQYLDFPGAINGVFSFELSGAHFDIVYSGNVFWYKLSSETIMTDYERVDSAPNIFNFTTNAATTFENCQDRECKVYVYKDTAYFVGMGDFLYLKRNGSKWDFKRVQDDLNTYAPTTTVNISCEESDLDEDSNPILYGSRETLEDVNVLTTLRRNTIIGSQIDVETADETRSYKLDSDTIESRDLAIVGYDYNPTSGERTPFNLSVSGLEKVEFSADDETPLSAAANSIIYFNLPLAAYPFDIFHNYVSGEYFVMQNGEWKLALECTKGSLNRTQWEFKIYHSGTQIYSQKIAYVASFHVKSIINSKGYALSNEDLASIITTKNQGINENSGGYASYANDDSFVLAQNGTPWGRISTTGLLTLSKNHRSIDGEPNITVTFRDANQNENAKKICSGSISVMAGTDGATNTLFVSGCSESKNYDWWSEATELTYFPSGNECAIGTENTAVIGYQRLGDSTLAIFKEQSQYEPSVYIRSGTSSVLLNEDGVLSARAGQYYTSGKFIADGIIAPHSLGALKSDILCLTKNGVMSFGISSETNATSTRLFKERSRLIKTFLEEHTLESKKNAKSIVWDGRYYLCIGDKMYIADSRFTYNVRGDMTDTYNYEWWYWENCPVNYFFEDSVGNLCFGTADGRICIFDELFTDRTYDSFVGSVSYDIENNRVQVGNADGAILEDGDFVFFKGDVYRELFATADIQFDYTDYTLTVGYAKAKDLYTGQRVCLDNIQVETADLKPHTTYLIADLDVASGSFKLTKEDGTYFNFAGTFRVLVNLNGEILQIIETEIDGGGSYLKFCNRYDDTETPYLLTLNDGEAITAIPYRYNEVNVVAEWVTPAFDMGANDYIKTLLRFTLAAEQIKNGKVTFGFETKQVSELRTVDVKGIDIFDFANFDFDKFTFNTGFESSFTKIMKANFNFIVFKFISDNDSDCCVHSLTLEYKVNRRNKGVW